jgi:dipeptidyl aminopeptidase/acylaminoacyl peptidase
MPSLSILTILLAVIMSIAPHEHAQVKTAPYGAWTSPITAQSLASSEVRLDDLRVVDGELYWIESRPSQGGRQVIVTRDRNDTGPGGVRELTPDGFNVRTRVHEYGGAPFLVADHKLYFSNFDDQRLYVQEPRTAGVAPRALTPKGARFADCIDAGALGLICVRQDNSDPKEVNNTLALVSTGAEPVVSTLFSCSDFVAYPRLSADGRRLAWIAWDHPNMPWDTTSLYVADLKTGDDAPALDNVRKVAGGHEESVLEPQWAKDGTLYFLSDRSDFWNLYAWREGETSPVLPRHAEFAGPLWSLGQANYALLGDGLAVARYGEKASDRLALVDLQAGTAKDLALPFVNYDDIHRLDADHVAAIAMSADQTPSIVVIDVKTGAVEVVRRPQPSEVPPAFISRAQAIDFPTAGGRTAHAFYYAPANADFHAPAGDKPPLLVMVHGGPTASASGAFKTSVQFWTSRGFAVVDVNYGGSSGYGRAYRQRLNGQWGVVDVQDVVAAARYLEQTDRVDPAKVAIRGGSAGGFTVLAALSQTDKFKAGADYYGISDMTALARDTHKFESRYLDSLIGPYPADKAIYDERSPLNHLSGFKAPLIVLQGADDPIVPPNQAQMIVGALRTRGAPVAYIEFAGEGHGFRKAENTIRAIEAELYFYGRVFGFTPAGHLPKVEIENLPEH